MINNYKDWFMLCNEYSPKVKEYEDEALKFYRKVHNNNDADIHRTLNKPLMKDFYIKDKPKLKKYIISNTLKGFFISFIFAIVIFFIFPIMQGIHYGSAYKRSEEAMGNVEFYIGENEPSAEKEEPSYFSVMWTGITDWFKGKDYAKANDLLLDAFEGDGDAIVVKDLLTNKEKYETPNITVGTAIIIDLIFIVLFTGAACGLSILSINSICNNIKKKEPELIPIFEVIPPIYRNSMRMDFVSRLFFKEQVETPEQAIDIVDDFFREHRDELLFNGVMYDVEYNPPFDYGISNSYDTPTPKSNNNILNDEDKPIKNPSLPADIDSKKFNGSEDAEKDLNMMIGLDSVKDQIRTLKNRIQFYGSSDVGNSGNHMVFMGSAGTGKTSVARVVTKIMYDLGYIKENKCIEVSGDYLKSPYTGQTGERTQAIVDYAMGGVLFIDEAYLLYDSDGSSASQEATGILLKSMEDKRKDFIVILAGYEEQMTKLLASNEGFNSRIKYKIYFPDYSIEEMYQIFTHFVNHYNNQIYVVDDYAKQLLLKTFNLEKQSKSFGNARTVRNAVDAVMDNYADRCINAGKQDNHITVQDVEIYYKARENELQHEIKNSSATNQLDESIIRLSELKHRVKEGSENPDTDIQYLIGLESFQKEVQALKGQKEFYGDAIIEQKQTILLSGPTGCGKSSLVKVLTGYLYQLGYIRDNSYLEISAEFLKGSYVGHTAKRADSIISYATGGVLFIKNIHLLLTNSDSFSQEAMSAIIEAINDPTKKLVIIISDSNNVMKEYTNLFNIIYNFPKYSMENMLQMFNVAAYKDKFTVKQEVFNNLAYYINSNPNLTAKDIIQIYNNTKKKHISQFTEENKYIIDIQDLDISTSTKPKVKLNIKKN